MSTRGSVGIIFNNEEKIGYNHYDSYPSGLGNEILTFLKGKTIDELKSIFSNITLVKNSDNDVWNWQNHSFNTEFLDQHNFLNDSLFCEFAYICKNYSKDRWKIVLAKVKEQLNLTGISGSIKIFISKLKENLKKLCK